MGRRPFMQTTLFDVSLFGFSCAATWVFICYCVVPKYVGVVIMCTLLTVGSSACLCSSVFLSFCVCRPYSYLLIGDSRIIREIIITS
jgi:hypothetical protein